MNLENLPINWFDFVVLIVILLGASRGRKHGMSVEMMISLQWVAIIFAGAFLYRPVGDWLSDISPMSHLFCYITVYVVTAMVVKSSFSLVKKSTGGKLVGSDVFGRAEFYLGMVAGAVRFTCILIAALALLNARLYTSREVAGAKAFQVDMYGSTFFTELSDVQQMVFKTSLLGSAVKNYAGFLLIAPTAPEQKGIQRGKDSLP